MHGLPQQSITLPIDSVIHGVGNILRRYSTGILPQSAAEYALRLVTGKIPRALGTLQSLKLICDKICARAKLK